LAADPDAAMGRGILITPVHAHDDYRRHLASMASRQYIVAGRVCLRGQKSLRHTMIQIFLCKLTDGEWVRVERVHLTHGFDTMAHAVEYAEHKNRVKWPRFDWLLEPQEAFLAFRD
jgi:hypothetical protein